MRALAKLDPLGGLSVGWLLRLWCQALAIVQGLVLIGALIGGAWVEAAWLSASVLALWVAFESERPPFMLALIAVWLGWWTVRFFPFESVHLGIGLVMAMSLYVLVRSAWSVLRHGGSVLRATRTRPNDWPELQGFTKHERRFLLRRAGVVPEQVTYGGSRWAVGPGVFLVFCLLEYLFYQPSDSALGAPKTLIALIAITPLMGARDPDSEAAGAVRERLREVVIPQFWREPWHWDRARREAARLGVTRPTS